VTDDELDWLIRALGQRAEDSFAVAVPDHAAVWGACHFYGDRQCVQINGIEVALQPRQYSFALQLSFGAPVKWWRETGCGGALNRPEFSRHL